jgi:hypothetical protein
MLSAVFLVFLVGAISALRMSCPVFVMTERSGLCTKVGIKSYGRTASDNTLEV